MDNYNEKLEQKLLDMIKQKEEADKRLLSLEIFIGSLVTIILLALVFVASLGQMENWIKVCLIAIGFITFIIGMMYALKIEQVAGYYECAECNYKYVPTFRSVLWAPHINRTRYMKCPECNEKSWQKKVLRKS